MDKPSQADRSFLERRRASSQIGLYVLPALLLVVMGTWAALFAWWPLAINPMYAAVHYEGVPFPRGTVTTYAITVTVLLNALLLLLGAAVVWALLSARRERRYLRMLAAAEEPPREASAPATTANLETRR